MQSRFCFTVRLCGVWIYNLRTDATMIELLAFRSNYPKDANHQLMLLYRITVQQQTCCCPCIQMSL